jgi:hypothetical protein
MQTIKEIHDKAMNLAEDAFHAQKSGREADAIRLFAEAVELEQEAANSLPLSEESEPTRSILFRSAASLAFNSKNYEVADRLIARGLSGFPPPEIMEELKNLYEDVNFMRHLSAKGLLIDPNQWLMTISGDATRYGGTAAEYLLVRVEKITTLFYRTTERLLKFPYRASGGVNKTIKDAYGLYINAFAPSSFAVSFQIGRPDPQTTLFPELKEAKQIEPTEIVDEIMSCYEIFEGKEPLKLKDKFKDEDYYQNFVGLAKQIAPDGNNVKLVGFTTIREGREKSVALRKSRKELRDSIKSIEGETEHEDKVSVQHTGILMQANTPLVGKFGTVKLIEMETKEKHMIKVPIPIMKDVVQPFYEELVTIQGYEKDGKIILEEINLASET